jgi:hypothetical protein
MTAREARTVARISRLNDQLPDVLTVAKADGHDPAARLRAVGEARHVLAFDQLAQEGRRGGVVGVIAFRCRNAPQAGNLVSDTNS